MKSSTSELMEATPTEPNERAKKLYRYITDLARRVGELTNASQAMINLFSMHIEIQRQKLRENCEKLMFLDPVNYGKKILELLWRKVYYDVVSAAKKLRETDTVNDSYLFTHLVCGIGQFHHIVSRIILEMKVQYKELDYIPIVNEEDGELNIKQPKEDEIQVGKSMLYSCLIYLGDLSRYQAEIFHTFDQSIAARYYLQAAHIDMSSGMPYNQLGNLYLEKNYSIDSVYYYIHCLNCSVPFDGALDNLRKIFDKNGQYYNTILSESTALTQTEHIQNTIVNFLSLIELWYFGKNDTNIPQRCNTIAQGLKISLDFDKIELPDINNSYIKYIQALEEENTTPSYMNPNLVYKIVLICLFTIPKLAELDEAKVFACKAFTLALLSQLLQKFLQQLHSIGLKNPASNHKSIKVLEKQPDVITTDNLELTETIPDISKKEPATNGQGTSEGEMGNECVTIDEKKTVLNGENKSSSKKKTLKRRRRRRFNLSDSSDESAAESDKSDIETFDSFSDYENSDSTYKSDDDGSQSEESNNEIVEEKDSKFTKGNQETIVENQENQPIVNGINLIPNENDIECKEHEMPKKEFNETELKKFLIGDNILPSIKLLQDWALNEKELILSCGDSGESLFQCVVDLLNILSHSFVFKSAEEDRLCQILKYTRNIVKTIKLEYKTIPLPEDINLRGTNICKFDKDAAEWHILDEKKLTVYEENMIRILNFIDFGNQIAKVVPRIRFNRTMKVFYLKKIPSTKAQTKGNHKKVREWHNSKQQNADSSEGGLLRRLGRLWLTSKVRELERSGRQPTTPALLALDTAVLCKHMRRVKQLLRSKIFVLLIPAVVLQELDDVKREESSARDAIRWLELQLKSGTRFLRAQRPNQSRPLPLIKCPRKAPSHIHNFIQILEFCNHFIGEDKPKVDGSGDSDAGHNTPPLLVLLTGNQTVGDEPTYKDFSVTGAAKSAGISIEYIEDFYTKWRQSVHKNDNKR